MTADHKPSIGSLIRFADGWEAEVTAHTERGFICLGKPGRSGLCLEQSIYTDTPEYRAGAWGFTVVREGNP